ncbi:MAG: hypothetical protein ACLQUZ_09840 [Rhizomicrobium sp.]
MSSLKTLRSTDTALLRAILRKKPAKIADQTRCRDGVIRLTLTAHHADAPDGHRGDPDTRDFSEYRSELRDDEGARAEIMRRFGAAANPSLIANNSALSFPCRWSSGRKRCCRTI